MTRQQRPGAWLPAVYYYLATVIGLAILLFGLIGGLRGLVTAAIPEISSEARYYSYPVVAKEGTPVTPTPEEEAKAKADAIDRARRGGYYDAINGAVAVIVGAPVFLWHLRQARRREPELMAAAAPATPPTPPSPATPAS